MSERSSYTPGTPCWVELATPDIEAAEAFYAEVLGWEIPEMPNSAELGGYRRAKLNGKDVAGVAPLMQEGQPPSWNTYVSVTDAKAALVAVGEAGGQVIVEAMDVRDLGMMGVFTDSTGAVCGVWQPGTFPGAQLVNEYGTFGWSELGTRDPGGAKQFYGAVFGWGSEDQDMGDMGAYTILKVGDASVGGMADITGRVPDEVPAHWLVYFTVEDTDGAAEKVKAGGGQVQFGPVDIPVGRFAIAADPAGAVFALMQPTEETLAAAP
jgi:predicted enzyme related to lactoylglutathione lyase